MKRVMKRMKEIAGQSHQGVTRWLEGMENVTLLRGHARFEGPQQVRVEGELLEAEKIFLNVGTRAFVPEFPGLKSSSYLTNSNVLDLESLPEHLIVVGGSYVGLEFGQIFRRLGSEVTIVERGARLISREDEDVSVEVQRFLESEGIELRLEADCFEVKETTEGIGISVDCKEGSPHAQGSHLLLGVGRVPNTDNLGVEEAGLEVDTPGYLQVDDQLRTNVPGIWALGDCNRKGAFTHTSYNDYEIVVANLFDDDPRRVTDRILCYGLFTDPPLGRVGMSEREARESGRRVLVGRRPMSRVGRARERSETADFIKVLVDADSQEILGTAILGINGDEAVHVLLDVMYAKAPYTAISRAVHIHPTVTELIPAALQEL
jgi:pyruvate/2-oxoglutarate dehydrogenase complex dihydrolipoamide dehydrogenase (E3) component